MFTLKRNERYDSVVIEGSHEIFLCSHGRINICRFYRRVIFFDSSRSYSYSIQMYNMNRTMKISVLHKEDFYQLFILEKFPYHCYKMKNLNI